MINKIINSICKAAGQVTKNYFNITTTYEPSGIVRERAFCYELYHQLRLNQGDNSILTLNGEIDKRGHKDFAEEDRKNPDFIFHIPGEHEGNTIICEVKGKLDIDGIIKDFDTMTTFVSSYHYQAGVLLIYNYSLKELLNRLANGIDKFINSEYAAQIHIITLPKAHKVKVTTLNKLKKNIYGTKK